MQELGWRKRAGPRGPQQWSLQSWEQATTGSSFFSQFSISQNAPGLISLPRSWCNIAFVRRNPGELLFLEGLRPGFPLCFAQGCSSYCWALFPLPRASAKVSRKSARGIQLNFDHFPHHPQQNMGCGNGVLFTFLKNAHFSTAAQHLFGDFHENDSKHQLEIDHFPLRGFTS